MTVDNYPSSPHYGRAYLTTTRFLNGPHGSYAESPIVLSYSDDGGATWSTPQEINGSSALCTSQETGPEDECDESSFSIPEVASDGTLFVHFVNNQNDTEWEEGDAFDGQIMVVRSDDGGVTFEPPVAAVQLEDGAADTPYSVIGRQTVWGHQIRWNAIGNLSADPTDPDHLVVVFADRGTPNPNAEEGCLDEAPAAPDYDPCDAGPGSDTDVFAVESTDGGSTWGPRVVLDGSRPDPRRGRGRRLGVARATPDRRPQARRGGVNTPCARQASTRLSAASSTPPTDVEVSLIDGIAGRREAGVVRRSGRHEGNRSEASIVPCSGSMT